MLMWFDYTIINLNGLNYVWKLRALIIVATYRVDALHGVN